MLFFFAIDQFSFVSPVPVPPRITPFVFEDSPVRTNQFVQVTCLVPDGDLPIAIKWMLNGKSLDEFPEISTGMVGKRSSFLSIESASYANTGNYTCCAANSAGKAIYSSTLQVNGYCFSPS